MRTSFRPQTLAIGLVALLASSICHAQTTSGAITGSVTDSSGAAIPAAKVTLRSQTAGDTRTITTSETGDFVFTGVQPGRYQIAVEQQGFKRSEKTDINLTASERLSTGAFVLEIGNITESVQVTAEGSPVQVASQERSAVLTTDQMDKLMSRGRDFLTLLRVMPGVVQMSDPQTIGRTGAPVISGMRQSFGNITIDGLSTNDLGSMQALGSPMNMDGISEMKVLLNNYQAEYGRTAGAVVNAVTRSGTRDFHGSAYYYKRHEQFNASPFFNNMTNQPKPRYRYNTWGWNFGGPVSLPGGLNRNRDKLFFFVSSELLPTSTPGNQQRLTMPTALERGGDFPSLLIRTERHSPFVIR